MEPNQGGDLPDGDTGGKSRLSKAHKAYDMAELMKTLQNLLKHHTTEEIDVFYRVLATYIELMEEDG